MRVRVTVASVGGDPVADLTGMRELARTLPGRLAQVAADYGTPAVLTAARARRGTLSMSRNKLGSQLDALPIVRDGGEHAEAEIVATPRGAWHLVEYGARPHEIRPKKKRGKRTQQFGGLPTPYGVFAKINHPGTAGTAVWDGAMADAEPVIDQAVTDAFDDAVTSTLGA